MAICVCVFMLTMGSDPMLVCMHGTSFSVFYTEVTVKLNTLGVLKALTQFDIMDLFSMFAVRLFTVIYLLV